MTLQALICAKLSACRADMIGRPRPRSTAPTPCWSTTMPDLSSLAASLTEAQRRLILSRSHFRPRKFGGTLIVHVKALCGWGLITRPHGSNIAPNSYAPSTYGLPLSTPLIGPADAKHLS